MLAAGPPHLLVDAKDCTHCWLITHLERTSPSSEFDEQCRILVSMQCELEFVFGSRRRGQAGIRPKFSTVKVLFDFQAPSNQWQPIAVSFAHQNEFLAGTD